MSEQDEIKGFLKEFDLEHYLNNFLENKIQYNQLKNLTEQDLVSIGINALGDRRRISEKINNIKAKKHNAEVLKHKESNRFILASIIKYSICLVALIAVLACFSDATKQVGVLEIFKVAILSWFVGFIYLIPSYNAFKNVHRYRWGILLANVFLGVTIFIWFICLFVSYGLFNEKVESFDTGSPTF